ncbi:MAG: pyruvate, phosphate dikinase [Solirubrobacterales bacterium]|nr:pyruvate, phosphate dikinase [Solirubrobacterales bacterium]
MTTISEHVIVLDAHTAADREAIGNKGASIARMLALGLPVPPAFVLPIHECRRYHAAGAALEPAVWDAVLEGVSGLERRTGRRLGDPEAPLLVSVRSGAAVSMPGMMDTILNLGMTDAVEAGMARLAGNAAFARSTHVRFVFEYSHTVLGADLDVPADDATADHVRAEVADDTGKDVPTDPHEQLRGAIHAVFGSWSSRRAVAYRRHWGIPEDGGTAVIVQAMVFGNLGAESGTGVLFTRNPLDGAPEPYGEWLPGGQGEDVVSGTHDCLPLSALHEALPAIHDELLRVGRLLEQAGGDVQDIEFTVERGHLYLLQTRAAKRSPAAAVRTAVDLAEGGAIDHATALRRVSAEQLAGVLAPRLSAAATAGAQVLARGTAACPGVASGRVVTQADDAQDGTVLVRPSTSPEDVSGMIAARGVVTERGGSTSHAAVVSRALGRPSVVGVGGDATAGWEGREITVDGTAGVVYAGVLPTEVVAVEDVPGLGVLLTWAQEHSAVTVGEAADGELADLDAAGVGLEPDTAVDVAALDAALDHATAARGAVLATAAGAEAAVRARLRTVVPVPGQHPATLLLRLAQATDPSQEET